jgi:hypothetical protein
MSVAFEWRRLWCGRRRATLVRLAPSAPATPPAARWHAVSRVIGATGGAMVSHAKAACVTRRSADKLQPLLDADPRRGGQAHGFGSDARKEEEVGRAGRADRARRSARSRCWCSTSAPTPPAASWRRPRGVTPRSGRWPASVGFLNGREVAKRMVARAGDGHRHTIMFTGATASLRGSAGLAAFAGAKHALRALAQSMARELGRAASMWRMWWSTAPSTPPSSATTSRALCAEGPGRHLNPDHIADQYWMLHQQPRDAWTHELDLRPWMEKF